MLKRWNPVSKIYSFTLDTTSFVKIKVTPDPEVDYDLYVKWDGTVPSETNWDCRPYFGIGVPEECTNTLSAGTYYFMVKYFTGDGDYQFVVNTMSISTVKVRLLSTNDEYIRYLGIAINKQLGDLWWDTGVYSCNYLISPDDIGKEYECEVPIDEEFRFAEASVSSNAGYKWSISVTYPNGTIFECDNVDRKTKCPSINVTREIIGVEVVCIPEFAHSRGEIYIKNIGTADIAGEEIQITSIDEDCDDDPIPQSIPAGATVKFTASVCEPGRSHTYHISGPENVIEATFYCSPIDVSIPSPTSPPIEDVPVPPPPPRVEYVLTLYPGWNMFSIPVKNYEVIESTCRDEYLESPLWYYSEGEYIPSEWPEGGKGYWRKVNTACSSKVSGDLIYVEDFPMLKAGWNLIGAPSTEVSLTDILGNCERVGALWKFDTEMGRYVVATKLVPGEAYWLKVKYNCRLGMLSSPG